MELATMTPAAYDRAIKAVSVQQSKTSKVKHVFGPAGRRFPLGEGEPAAEDASSAQESRHQTACSVP